MKPIITKPKEYLMHISEEDLKYYLQEKKRDLKLSILSSVISILLTGVVIFLMFKYLNILAILGIGIICPFALIIMAGIPTKR